jgi:hypothetical protein
MVVKTDAEWRQRLSDEEYLVTRRAGTERPLSSEMCSLFEPGIYSCLCLRHGALRRLREIRVRDWLAVIYAGRRRERHGIPL